MTGYKGVGRVLAAALAVVTAAAALAGCTAPTFNEAEPQRLADVKVSDPNFDFGTSQTVRLELTAAAGAQPQALEVTDSEGRRLMDGAFKSGASIDLKVPVGRAQSVTLRVGQGDAATERVLTVDAQQRAVGAL